MTSMPADMAGADEKVRLTTVSAWALTKARLDAVKLTDSQSYDEVLNALLDFFESKGKLGQDRLRRP